jgi:hypothetical protein
MTKRSFFGAAAVVAAVALTGSALVASNMGFKLNYSLDQTGAPVPGGTSKVGINTLALPDNRQSGLNTSIDLMNDIGFAGTASIQRFIKASDSLEVYTGRKGSPNANFNLAAGEAYYVTMTTTTPYIVVGSDDPALTYTLNAPQAGVSKSGTNFFAYNYHQTAATSKALMDDIGFTSTASIQRYIEATNGLEVYTGRKGSPNADFPLVPGEGYFVVMTATVNYAPSHY